MKNTKQTTNSFTIDYTFYSKGVGIILLLVHHFIFVRYTIPFKSGDLHELVVLFGKVCVPLFAVLSGYGITKSYNKYISKNGVNNGRFVFNHIKKLLINYWWVYIPTLILALLTGFRGYPQEVYGTGVKGILYFVLDFTGMRAIIYSPTYCNTWWFIEATLVFYALFPLIYKAYQKQPLLSMSILASPLIVNLFIKLPTPFNNTDRDIFYLFSFAVGMVLADKNTLDKAIVFCCREKQKYVLMVALCLPFSMLAAMYIKQFGMLMFAVEIIAVVILMKSIKINLHKLFEFFGKYSMNVFLIHSLYMDVVKSRLIFARLPAYVNLLLQFVFILVSAFAISYFMEIIKRKINKVFNKRRVRV